MITIYTLAKGDKVVLTDVEDLPALLEQAENEWPIVWVDMNEPTTEEEQLILTEIFDFHTLAIRDVRRERQTPGRGDHLPKVEDYGKYLFSIINPIELEKRADPMARIRISTRQINVFLGRNYIVTHHYEPSNAITHTISNCQRNSANFGRGPDYLYHMLLDDIIDQYIPILDEFDREIEIVEDEIFERRGNETLHKVLNLKRQVFTLRKIATYQREMVQHLSRGEFPLITQEEIAYYRNVYDHLVRATDLAESYREGLTGLLDAHLSTTSNRLNEVMKVLAIISTFFLPLTFIAGVYGMNFENMPEIEWRYGYAFSLGIMLLVAIGMYIYFRRKKWL